MTKICKSNNFNKFSSSKSTCGDRKNNKNDDGEDEAKEEEGTLRIQLMTFFIYQHFEVFFAWDEEKGI